MSITAVIKARNEADNIESCIASLADFVDNIVVIDDQSTDDTPELARKCGATVIPGEPHHGLIDRLDRQGFEYASTLGEWVIRMDADERMTSTLARALTAHASDSTVQAVKYARRYYFVSGWLDHGGWLEPHHIGFFRCSAWDRAWDCALHSQVPINGKTVTVSPNYGAYTLHLDYFSVEDFVRRSLLGYAKTEGSTLHSPPASMPHLLYRAAKRFTGRFIIRRGYRDGRAGAIAALLLLAYDVTLQAYLMGQQGRECEPHDSQTMAESPD